MGNTSYSADSYAMYTRTAGTKTRAQIFTQNDCHQTMSPHGLEFREARDSEAMAHSSLPHFLALAVEIGPAVGGARAAAADPAYQSGESALGS